MLSKFFESSEMERLKDFINILSFILTVLFLELKRLANSEFHKLATLKKGWFNIDKVPTFLNVVKFHGYDTEIHRVTTEDGYILEVHRILGADNAKKPVVLFVHGLICASDLWILQDPDKNYTFQLVDKGYDAWFINLRGNYYSRGHKTLSSTHDREFWDFSMHEMGLYDLSATIDYILALTGEKKVFLITHSMGAILPYILLSHKPIYEEKIHVIISLAPAITFTHPLPQPLQFFTEIFVAPLQLMAKLIGICEVLPRNVLSLRLIDLFCTLMNLESDQRLMFIKLGFINAANDYHIVKSKLIRRSILHFPQGTSLKLIIHYRQIVLSGELREFDYDYKENWIRYDNWEPPVYQLQSIKTPTVVYYGPNDISSTQEDVKELLKLLPNAEARVVNDKLFGHHDFFLNDQNRELLGQGILDVFSQYVNEDRLNNQGTDIANGN